MNDKERVMIFIDGSNLYHITKSLILDKKPNDFDFKKFIERILDKRKLVRVYYYNCPLDISKDFGAYVKQQKFFEKIKKIENFNVVLCRMQKLKLDGKIIYQAKEDDIHLTVDMVKLA